MIQKSDAMTNKTTITNHKHLTRKKTRTRIKLKTSISHIEQTLSKISQKAKASSSSLFFLYLLVLLSVNLISASDIESKPNETHNSKSKILFPTPTSVSKAYADLPQIHSQRNISQRIFSTQKISSRFKKQEKPSKLFTYEPMMKGSSEELVSSSTSTTTTTLRSTTKRSSPFLTQTDNGPKIRLEPFFNILTTFKSLALGSSKEQKFSPSYQTIEQNISEAKQKVNNGKGKRGKGQKGLRQKVTSNSNEGPIPIPIPKPVINIPEPDIITLEDAEREVKPADVLSVSMSTSMSMTGPDEPDKNNVKGTVEDVELFSSTSTTTKRTVPLPSPLPQTQGTDFAPSHGPFAPSHPQNIKNRNKRGKKGKGRNKFAKISESSGPTTMNPKERERRLRFENFHNSESELQAEESQKGSSNIIPPGYLNPQGAQAQKEVRSEEFQLVSRYPTNFHPALPRPPPPRGSHFGRNNFLPKPPIFNPNYNRPIAHEYFNNYPPNYYTNEKQPGPISPSNSQEASNLSKSDFAAVATVNPHQKLGVMTGFELFYKEYKLLVWAAFLFVAALAILSILVFVYINNPPTEVVTARSLFWGEDGFLSNPQILKFLGSLYDFNEKGGGNGKEKRKRFKMRRTNMNGSESKKDL